MRGVVFTGDRELELMEFPDPTPGPDEVVIEMKASGMCGSDLHQYRRPKAAAARPAGSPRQPRPGIGGHEPCGIVAAVGAGVVRQQAQGRAARHGAPLQGLHRVQPLPLGLVAAVPGTAGPGLRQQRPWRPRALSEGAGLHDRAAARRIVVRDRRGDLVRHRHRLWRAAPHPAFRQRHDRDLRPGSGRAVGDAARARRWARGSSPSTSAPSGWSAPRNSAPPRRSTRARTIRWARSRI